MDTQLKEFIIQASLLGWDLPFELGEEHAIGSLTYSPSYWVERGRLCKNTFNCPVHIIHPEDYPALIQKLIEVNKANDR